MSAPFLLQGFKLGSGGAPVTGWVSPCNAEQRHIKGEKLSLAGAITPKGSENLRSGLTRAT